MKELILQTLGVIIGETFNPPTRAATMECFNFGKERTVVNRRHGQRVVSQFALHTESPWRIRNLSAIIVGSADMFQPAGDPDEIAPDDFQWDVHGANRCDELIEAFFANRSLTPVIIETVDADDIGGLKIGLSKGY